MTVFCVPLFIDSPQTGASGVVRQGRRYGPFITFKITSWWAVLRIRDPVPFWLGFRNRVFRIPDFWVQICIFDSLMTIFWLKIGSHFLHHQFINKMILNFVNFVAKKKAGQQICFTPLFYCYFCFLAFGLLVTTNVHCSGARGRAGVRCGAHFRLLQRHLCPRDRPFRTRDHLQVRIPITLDVSGYVYFLQHCFICRLSDSTVSEDARIEPRTVATPSLTVRRSYHSARSHPLTEAGFGSALEWKVGSGPR